jgi:SAM-dependent methyltransferase
MAPGIKDAEAQSPLPSLIARASGTVLELGPGNGNQVSRYDKDKVRCVHGVESSLLLACDLLETCAKDGWNVRYATNPANDEKDGKPEYVIHRQTVEDWLTLPTDAIREKGITTVLSVQCLCSVPEPRKVCRELYNLLPPGGELFIFEHVAAKDEISRFVQKLYGFVWPKLVGGCHLGRDLESYLRDAGEWESIELEQLGEDWFMFRRVIGRLVKAKQ